MNFNLAKRLKQKVRPHIAMDNILKKGSRQGVSQGPVHWEFTSYKQQIVSLKQTLSLQFG